MFFAGSPAFLPPCGDRSDAPGFLDNYQDNNNWLGRGFGTDPIFCGFDNEFRIYDKALGPQEVLASYLVGPDAGAAGVKPSPSRR